jgi:hypothetical protein
VLIKKISAKALAEITSTKLFFFEIIDAGSDPSPRPFCTKFSSIPKGEGLWQK